MELVAAVPLLLLAMLGAWQAAAAVWAALDAQERARHEALRAGGAPGEQRTVTSEVRVPRVVPGMSGLRARARASVRVAG